MTKQRSPRVTITLSVKERQLLESKRNAPNEDLATAAKRILIYGTELIHFNEEVKNAVNSLSTGFDDLKFRIKKLREGELVSSILNKESEKLLTRLFKEHIITLEQIFTDLANHSKDLATRMVGGLESLETGLSKITKNQDAFAKTLANFSIGLQDLSDRLLTRGHA